MTRHGAPAALCSVIAGLALATGVAEPARTRHVAIAARPAYRQVTVTRVLALPRGSVTRSFPFTIHADYADLVILDVPRRTVAGVRAMPLGRMQIIGATTSATGGVCRRSASRVVCTQGLEWCGLIQGRWRATIRKTSQAAALVRVRLIFVRPAPVSRSR